MNHPTTTGLVPRAQIVETLTHLRDEWEQALPGDKLIDVQCNLGLLLADLGSLFDLSQEELKTILGDDLHKDLNDL